MNKTYLDAIEMALKALNTAPMFCVPSLPEEFNDSYKVAGYLDALIKISRRNKK